MMNRLVVDRESQIYQLLLDFRNGNKAALDDIFEQLMPFCLRVCSKTCGKYIYDNDDEASIARLALVEALEKFDPAKGTMMVFIGQVIRNRVIDYKRKEQKQSIISFKLFSRGEDRFEQEADESFFEEIIDSLARKQEIDALQGLLQPFNIAFHELPALSPQQDKTRLSAQQIARIIANDDELRNHLLKKKTLPLKELETSWQINRRLADRYRKYILVTALIYMHDFPLLQEYILPKKGGRADENK
ncbi:MAG TPA: sigma factor [Syntrophomonas sp.]|jgi:RNA polymerase sigma factor|nr:sigma factor [Syntrophomonas sp.]